MQKAFDASKSGDTAPAQKRADSDSDITSPPKRLKTANQKERTKAAPEKRSRAAPGKKGRAPKGKFAAEMDGIISGLKKKAPQASASASEIISDAKEVAKEASESVQKAQEGLARLRRTRARMEAEKKNGDK